MVLLELEKLWAGRSGMTLAAVLRLEPVGVQNGNRIYETKSSIINKSI